MEKSVLAIKGTYHDGKVILERSLPIVSAEVIVVFPDHDDKGREMNLSVKAKKELFEEFSGSVNRVIDLKAEKREALAEKYENID